MNGLRVALQILRGYEFQPLNSYHNIPSSFDGWGIQRQGSVHWGVRSFIILFVRVGNCSFFDGLAADERRLSEASRSSLPSSFKARRNPTRRLLGFCMFVYSRVFVDLLSCAIEARSAESFQRCKQPRRRSITGYYIPSSLFHSASLFPEYF
jgi:hypothetical protein